ncbi:MAG: glycoside hydrolase family 26 protein [Treponema sp.]|nr:glycoside hydrolase family 26 protein [Treponema sp.]MCL2272600.1 glycoside hydrolase family 26 protein [Treponema sp.]
MELQNKKRLLNFLKDEYGKRIISGQMDTSWTTNEKMDMIKRIHTDTGKYPAIKGFDFLQLPFNYAPFFGGAEQTQEAVEWWEGKNNGVSLLPENPEIHGIITFCWHWRAGRKKHFYTEKTDFRIPWKNNKLDIESENFKLMIDDMERVAHHLDFLREKDIPVLWRPLHEASGGWFWWGASGPQPYIALWEFMHDYFTNEKKLNNLIWVWSAEDANWFPNPSTVDITGVDLYTENYDSLKQEYEKAFSMAPAKDKITALSENDKIPDPDECKKQDMMWSYFMTWNDMRFKEGETRKDNYWTGEYHNPRAHKEKVYNHPLVITLDKLPDLTNYRAKII